MKEPKRLRHSGADPITRQLLEAGHGDAPPNARLAHILGGLAGTGAALGAQAAAAAGSAAAITKAATPVAAVLKWLGLGAIAGVVVSASSAVLPSAIDEAKDGAIATPNSEPRAAPALPAKAAERAPDRTATVEVPALGRALPESTPAPTVPQANARHRPSPETGAAHGRAATPSTAREPPSDPLAAQGSEADRDPSGSPELGARRESPELRAMREEVAALGLAKAALNRGAAAEALAIVQSYHTRFPAGRLGPEAAYIEMEAAYSTGNHPRARAIAERLARGTTPHAERARVILKGTER